MRIRTFVKKIQQNRITDFDKFLTPAYPMSFRRELVKRGIRVEDAVALNEFQPIREAIIQGYLPEKYAEWMTSEHDEVRYALAKTGHYPETYIHDVNKEIRIAVLEKHPEYVSQLLTTYDNYKAVHEYIIRLDTPDTTLLKTFIEAPKPEYCDDGLGDVLSYQLQALTADVTPIEKTMTRKQLFESGNPLWVNGINAYFIRFIISLICCAKRNSADAYEEVLNRFEEICNEETFASANYQIQRKYHFDLDYDYEFPAIK